VSTGYVILEFTVPGFVRVISLGPARNVTDVTNAINPNQLELNQPVINVKRVTLAKNATDARWATQENIATCVLWDGNHGNTRLIFFQTQSPTTTDIYATSAFQTIGVFIVCPVQWAMTCPKPHWQGTTTWR